MPREIGKKVFVALSGGVDSSVAAYLLKKNGFSVVGVFIKVWQPPFLSCAWPTERRDAMRVCSQLKIPFLTFNFEDEYKKNVIDEMVLQYKKGVTPNPDILCNKFIKFDLFLKKAISMGADYIATGHHVKVKKNEGIFQLKKGVDNNKDQSYFLWTITQNILSKTLFPIGDYQKKKVRELAKKNNIPTAEKSDSQGLCFVGKLDFKEFLKKLIKIKCGDVVNKKGNIIGSHNGAILYTIGERHGFTITDSNNKNPYYVIDKNILKNTITVSDKKNKSKYWVNKINLLNSNWISGVMPYKDKTYTGRVRYRQKLENCKISCSETKCIVTFDKKLNDIASGQSFVLYDGDILLGGGIIDAN